MYNYDILLSNTYSDKNEEMRSINLLRAKQIEGMVMISWDLAKEHIEYIENCGIPTTYISKTARDYDVPTVSVNNQKATYDMTKHLILQGHKKIAFVMTSAGDTRLEKERLDGYKDALSENGIEFNEELVRYGGVDYNSGYESTKDILEKGIVPDAIFVTGDEAAVGAMNAAFDKGYDVPNDISVAGFNDVKIAIEKGIVPDAIFVTGDEAAVGAMNAAFDKGYDVPNDISVAGFNDVKIARMYRPKLTTVHQPLYDMGAVAIRMVIKMINGEEIEEKKVELPHRIEERESVIKK